MVTRTRLGSSDDARPEICTGAISNRWPLALGEATSTTRPSSRTAPNPNGAAGARIASVRNLAAPNPVAPKAISIMVTTNGRHRTKPQLRAVRMRTVATTAAVTPTPGSPSRVK